MKLKCDKLDWIVNTTNEQTVVSMSFESFEQSSRFVEMIVKFILAERERKPPQILEDVAWYYPPDGLDKRRA